MQSKRFLSEHAAFLGSHIVSIALVYLLSNSSDYLIPIVGASIFAEGFLVEPFALVADGRFGEA